MSLTPWQVAANVIDPPPPEPDPYADDPVAWVQDKLGEHVWSKQAEVMESVRDHRHTAVKSCHSTGKSWGAGRITSWWIDSHPPGEAFVVTTAPTAPQVKAILWKEINRVHHKGQLLGRTNQTEWWLYGPDGNEEMVAYGRKPSEFDPSAFQGIHARYVLVVIDEACGVPAALWEAADSLVSNENSRLLAIGNPDDPDTEFFEACKPGSGYNVIGISAYDTPNFTGEPVPDLLRELLISKVWVEEKRRKWGEDNPYWMSKVLGEFPETTKDGLIRLQWVREAQQRELEPGEPVELGVDVGGGGDRSVIACRRGPVVRILRRDQNPDTMETCGNVLHLLGKTRATLAKVDEIGIGKGVVDRAQELGKPVQGVNVGQRAINSEGFINLRAEGYWGLRERFEDGTIDIDMHDEDLAAQLVNLKYKRTSSGKIQMEAKDQMRARGEASPDDADAVMLAFCVPPPPPKKQTSATWGRR